MAEFRRKHVAPPPPPAETKFRSTRVHLDGAILTTHDEGLFEIDGIIGQRMAMIVVRDRAALAFNLPASMMPILVAANSKDNHHYGKL